MRFAPVLVINVTATTSVGAPAVSGVRFSISRAKPMQTPVAAAPRSFHLASILARVHDARVEMVREVLHECSELNLDGTPEYRHRRLGPLPTGSRCRRSRHRHPAGRQHRSSSG